MRKTTLLKRITCVALAAMMAMAIPGCGKDKNDAGTKDGSKKTTEESRDLIEEAKDTSNEGIFEPEDLAVTGYLGDITDIKIAGDYLYILTNEWFDGDTASAGDSLEVSSASGPVEGELIEGDEETAPAGADESAVTDLAGPGGTDEEKVETVDEDETEDKVASEDTEDEESVTEISDSDLYSDDISGSSTYRIYRTSAEGGECEFLAERESSAEKDEYIDSIIVTPSGDVKALVCEYTDTSSNYSLYDIEDGGFTNELDLNKTFSIDKEAWINKIAYDKDGNIVIATDTGVKIYDKDNNLVDEVNSDDYVEGVNISRNGTILLQIYTWDDATEESDTLIKEYDANQKKFINEYDVAVNNISYNGLFGGTDKYLFMYQTPSAVYGFNDATGESEKVIDFNKSDINGDYLWGIEMVNEEEILVIDYDYSGDEYTSKLTKYVKSDSTIEKKVLTLATLWGSWDVRQKVIAYNKAQDEYKINIVDYSEADDPEGKFSADIAAGNLPDMYLVENGVGNMSTSQCIAKGLFEDLTPYFEADPDMQESDFIENAFDALKDDGKLYLAASSCYIDTLVGKASEIGEEPGWTFQEMKDYVSSKPAECRIFYSTSKSDTLSYFMSSLLSDFVDWEAGTCSFDSQDFKDILEMCNRGTKEMDWDNDDGDYMEMLKTGEMMFMQGSFSPSDIQIYDSLYDGDLVFKGYPNNNGSGSYFSFSDCVAMSSTCEDKDGAWKFIREFLTEDGVASSYANEWGFPLRKDVFEEFMNNQTITEETTDKYGNKIYPIEGAMSFDGSTTIDMKPLTEEECDAYRDYVASASGRSEYDGSIQEIVEEEAEAYFNGDKSADEVADIIQNRVTTYINENK